MDSSIKLLRKHKCITITGDAGVGKTCFCKRLVSLMKIKYPKVPAIILTDPREIKKLNFANGYILFIDNILEKYISENTRFNDWSATFDYMNDLIAKENIFFIFAARNGVWHVMKDKFLDYSLFKLDLSNAPVIDLSRQKYGMTYEEKIEMLHLYCKQYGVDPKKENIAGIAKIDTPPRFPLLCNIFFSEKSYLKRGVDYFKVTARSDIKKNVNDLLVHDQNLHYAIMVSVFSNYSSKKKDMWYSLKDIEKAIDTRIVNSKKIKPSKIKSCLEGLLKTFIESSPDGYRFKNCIVYEAVLSSFKENYPDVFIELISEEVLFNYVRTENYTCEKHEVIVRFPCEMLAKKLVELCMANTEKPYPGVHAHPSFHDKELFRHFVNIVKNKMLSHETNGNCKFNFQFFRSVIKINILDTYRQISKKSQFKNIFLTKFLNPFVTGACEEKNDYLASGTIKEFFEIYEFDFDVFEIVINYDLFYTYKQFLNNNEFSKKFLKILQNEKSSYNYITKATTSGAQKCLRHMQGLCNKKTDINAYSFFIDTITTIYQTVWESLY